MIFNNNEKFGYSYRRAIPLDFDINKKYPIIFFMHGAGERGDNVELMSKHGFLYEASLGKEFPAVLVAPQLKTGTWFDKFETLQKFVKYFVGLPYIDKNRVYITGLSMGGFCCWQLLMSMPTVFAAGIICCGGGMDWNTPSISHIPVYVIHGALDKIVPVDYSICMANGLNRNGGEALLKIYEDVEHNCWVRAFKDEKIISWLFSKKRKK